MRLLNSNIIEGLPISDDDKKLLAALLLDLGDINAHSGKPIIYIDWEDRHTDYSPEWTDPCPDYYGTYSLRTLDGDLIGVEMDIEELDSSMCLLYNFVVDL